MDAKRDKPEGHHPDTTDKPDHYAALRVDASASQQEIARAYRALMRNLHPDIDGGSPGCGEAGQPGAGQSDAARNNDLLRIMRAFAVLRDPVRRAAYDKSRDGTQPVSRPQAGPQSIPVRYIRNRDAQPRPAIRITPVRWESGPWT
jgi:DnaJ-class molecular chaperone